MRKNPKERFRLASDTLASDNELVEALSWLGSCELEDVEEILYGGEKPDYEFLELDLLRGGILQGEMGCRDMRA